MKAIILSVLLSSVCFCFIINQSVIAQETEATERVQVQKPRYVTIVSEKEYTGQLQPRIEVKVYANIQGKIVELNAAVGQKVRKDDILAKINAQEANIAAIKAEVALSVAKAQLTTTEANAQTRLETQLVTAEESVAEAVAKHEESKSLSEMRIRNQLVQAESTLKVAESNLERARVSSEQGLERAKTEFSKTTSDYERDKALHEQELISDSAFESSETRYKLGKSRYEEAVAAADQFNDGTAQLAVEKARAELSIAQKIVESKGWEREIAAAESKITQAKASLVATQKLVEAKSWEREIAIAQSAVNEAEEQLKLAREQVNQASINSPIDGIVSQRHMEKGDFAKTAASSGTPIFTVIAIDVLKAVWTIPVGDANRIKVGDMVLINTASGIQNIVATVDFISPTVKPGENTVLVHATVPNTIEMTDDTKTPNQNSKLKPGTTISISIKTGERKNVQMLPRRSVLNIQNGRGNLYVVEENTVRVKQVSVGGIYGSEIEVSTRLPQNEQVIVDGQHRLQEGIEVSIGDD
ncbi:hypothetical protein C6497_16495 [Candidatus Poribacteria bacterium]|nr:MAG: hypothetical protein C6497_16495 [Candidatus Poribacteria bacterium]